MHACMYVCTYIRMYICMHVHTYVCMHACMYIHIQVPLWPQTRLRLRLPRFFCPTNSSRKRRGWRSFWTSFARQRPPYRRGGQLTVCARACEYMCIFTCAHTHTHTHTLSNLSAALVSLASRFCPTAAALVANPLALTVKAEGQPVTNSEKSAPWYIYYTKSLYRGGLRNICHLGDFPRCYQQRLRKDRPRARPDHRRH